MESFYFIKVDTSSTSYIIKSKEKEVFEKHQIWILILSDKSSSPTANEMIFLNINTT